MFRSDTFQASSSNGGSRELRNLFGLQALGELLGLACDGAAECPVTVKHSVMYAGVWMGSFCFMFSTEPQEIMFRQILY